MSVMPSKQQQKKDTCKSALSLNLGKRERERLLFSIAIMKCEMQT